MLWLVGDSIFRGFALGVFADTLAENDPRRFDASPAAMINRMLGYEAARCAALTGLPNGIEVAVAGIAALPARPGDVIVLLDAGDHGGDPDAHERSWTRLIATAQTHGCEVIACSAPDNLAERNWRRSNGRRTAMWHALAFGDRSHNQAVEAAARARDVRFLDVAGHMHDFHAALRAEGRSAYLRDDVHLNVEGQAELCRLLIGAVWPGRETADGPGRC